MRQLVYRVLSLIFFLGIFQLLAPSAFAFSGSGSGTSGDPYQITTCSQLHEIENSMSAYYIQNNDIDCTGYSFKAIGAGVVAFTGTLDGQNYTISNITITSNDDHIGLFELANNATIKNVRLISGSVTGSQSVSDEGSFVGAVSSGTITIQHCTSALTLTPAGTSYVGGIVGISSSTVTIQKSSFTGTIVAASGMTDIGGLGGYLFGTTNISDSYVTGTIDGTPSIYTAGIVANVASLTMTSTYSSAQIISNGTKMAGLFVQLQSGTVSNSFSASTMSGSAARYGIYGIEGGTASNVYFDQYLAGTATSGCSSGCTGVNSGNSTPSYFFGNSTNAPLNNVAWNFVNTWQTNIGNYPTLQGFISPVSTTPTPAPSSGGGGGSPSVPSCGASAPTNAPNLFQVSANGTSATVYFVPVSGSNTGYYISYGVGSSAMGFGTQFGYSNTSGVVPYTINSLFPGTWYFKVRGQNGCMPGGWSNIISVKVSSFGNSSSVGSSNKVLGAATHSGIVSCSNYTVQSGDTLWGIANSHLGNGAQFSSIMQKNNLSSTLLHVGQVLKVGC